MALLSVACIGLIVVLVRGARDDDRGRRVDALEPTIRAEERDAREAREILHSGAQPEARVSETSAPPAPSADAKSFEGRGVIRGHVEARGGRPFPATWTLIVEPSPLLVGRERAVSREIEFTHGERDFRVEDLPFAGYRVRARAAGLNNHPADVLLVRGSANQFVEIAFLPSGLLAGTVLEHSGSPAEGVRVSLSPVAASALDAAPQEAVTDAAGRYAFESVLDGDYELSIGGGSAPLLATDSLSFRAPSLDFPTRTLPPTCNANVSTLDSSGLPVGEVRVSGFAPGGSAVDGVSGIDGRLVLRHLLPGKYRFTARAKDGRQGAAHVMLDAEKTWSVELLLAD